MSFSSLFFPLLFGLIGSGFFVYGKRQTDGLFLGTGIALMLFPYFVPGVVGLIVAGLILAAAPFVIRRYSA